MEGQLKTATIRKLKTSWLEFAKADAPILFFLHGYPDTPETWEFQFAHFKNRFHIVAPYSRGVRPTQQADNLARYSTNALVLDHLEILRHVDPTGERPVICVGHDLGAVQSWHLAGFLGRRLAGMVIINGVALPQMVKRLANPRQQLKSWYIYAFLVPKIADTFVKKFPSKMLTLAHKRGGLSVPKRPKLSQSLAGVVHPLRQYRAFALDMPRALTMKTSRLNAPVMVLYGCDDPFLIEPSTDEMQSLAKKFTIRMLDGGHWLHRDQAGDVNMLIDEFVTGVKRNEPTSHTADVFNN